MSRSGGLGRTRRAAWLALLFVSLLGQSLALGACEGSSGATQPAASRTRQPVAVATPSAASSSRGVLTGFGASREVWEAHHRQAPGFMEGSAYLPMVGDKPYYSYILWDEGEPISMYGLTFPQGTTLEEAEAKVLDEFPADATFDPADSTNPQCLVLRVRSEQVERELPEGKPVVGLFGPPGPDAPFTATDVRLALIGLSLDRQGDVPGVC